MKSRPTDDGLERLHPGTLWIPLLGNLLNLVPAFVAGVFFLGLGSALFFGGWFVLLPLGVSHVVRYLAFRYRIGSMELFLRSGLFWRNERRIPLERIQDTRIRQGIVHQLFRVARLEITTAGSEEREAALSVVSVAKAAEIRDVIVRHQGGIATGADGRPAAAAGRPETVLRLGMRELLLGALTSRLATTVFALIGAVLYFTIFIGVARYFYGAWDEHVGKWEEKLIPDVEGWWSVLLRPLSWDDTLTGSVLLILGGLLLALGRFVVRYYRYRLSQSGRTISRAHGLFTVQSSSLACDRIQALKIEEGLLRRWFGLAAMWADSGGDRNQVDDEKKRDPFVPVAARGDAYRLVTRVLAGLPDAEPEWNRVSRLAIRRGTRIGWSILLVAMIPNFFPFGWFALAFLPGFPLLYYLNVQWYRNTGYWVDDDHLIRRKGWINRRTLYLPLRNLQSVSMSRSWFDRRHGLATLRVDTAGQSNTGGGASIRNLPVKVAGSLQARLAKRVSSLAPPGIRSGARAGSTTDTERPETSPA